MSFKFSVLKIRVETYIDRVGLRRPSCVPWSEVPPPVGPPTRLGGPLSLSNPTFYVLSSTCTTYVRFSVT